ncbi:efflux RND transporter periplasmic adaptor subunit [Breznakiellaceae bacterium SP9]
MKIRLLFIGIVLVLSVSSCSSNKSGALKSYDFAVISRGTLEKTVSSSGTLKPVATVNVLPRMSGKVEKINVDYNSTIKKGEILAQLNTDMLRLKREQQNAQVVKARANYALQQINYASQERLAEKELISEYELRSGKTTLDIQSAELAAAEANLQSIETEINQYAFIISPIDGVVLSRNVNEGDTVVDSSSNNSSSIFVLAENLEEMQIEAAVGELDIASIREGQEVRFTLESLPGRTFSGAVDSIHLMPAVQDNVVSYTVIINTENKDGVLLPGMTCSVDFIVQRNENVLLVPNSALRFAPTTLSAEQIADAVFNAGLVGMDETQKKDARDARAAAASQTSTAAAARPAQTGISGLMSGPMGGGMRIRPQGTAGSGAQAGGGRSGEFSALKPLWYLNALKLDCVLVRHGSSDGSRTEIRPIPGNTVELESLQVIIREKL